MIRHLSHAKVLLVLLLVAPTLGQEIPGPKEKVRVAAIEAEIPANLPDQDRKTLTALIDTVLTTSLSKQQEFEIVDRQALDKVLAEKRTETAGSTTPNVAESTPELRPFLSASVLLCSTVRSANAEQPARGPFLISVEAVAVQTGQLLADLNITSDRGESNQLLAAAIETKLESFWATIARNSLHISDLTLVEVTEVKLTSSLPRLQWMADDLTDTLRSAGSASQRATVLIPRHPSSTKEERLLRVMGLAAAGSDDQVAGLQPTPDLRASVEIIEKPAEGISFDKTTVTLVLKWWERDEKIAAKELAGTVGEYENLRKDAVEWLKQRLSAQDSTKKPANEEQLAKEQAQEELVAARQLTEMYKVVVNRELQWRSRIPFIEAFRNSIARHALRASHLDPANEEAAYLTALTIDSLYSVNALNNSEACLQRTTVEGQRYIDRFGQPIVRSNRTYNVLDAMCLTGHGVLPENEWHDWISTSLRARAQVEVADEALYRNGNKSGLWYTALGLTDRIFLKCPEEDLESHYLWWHNFWKQKIESLNQDNLPTWEYASLGYYARRHNVPELRRSLEKVAQLAPLASQRLWRESRDWTALAKQYLREAGDQEWQTWKPEVSLSVCQPTEDEWNAFMEELCPTMPRPEDYDGVPTFPAEVTVRFPPEVVQYGRSSRLNDSYNQPSVQPLCVGGQEIWFSSPGILKKQALSNLSRDFHLYTAITADIEQGSAELQLKLTPIDWPEPPHSRQEDTVRRSPFIVRCASMDHGLQGERVWIGTHYHGLACFWKEDATWKSRWYGAEAGLPVQSVIHIAPCIHDGKHKLFLCVGISNIPDRKNEYLLVLDPATAQSTLLNTIQRNHNSQQLAFVAPDGKRIPVRQYRPDLWPNLDLKDVTKFVGFAADPRFDGPQIWLSSHDRGKPRIWGAGAGAIGELDIDTLAMMSPHLPSTLSREWVYYDTNTQFLSSFLFPNGGSWYKRSTPQLGASICSAGADNIAWGIPTGSPGRAGQLPALMAYRMPTSGENDWAKNDRWFGPLKPPHDHPLATLMPVSQGKLYVTSMDGIMCVVSCDQFMKRAEKEHRAYSTSEWQQAYHERVQNAGWTCVVRDQVSDRKWQEALKTLEAVKNDGRAIFYRAMVFMRMGNAEAEAAKLYGQIVDNPTSSPPAKMLAIMNRISLFYATRLWQEMLDEAERFCRMFPALKPRGGANHVLDQCMKEARTNLASQRQKSKTADKQK